MHDSHTRCGCAAIHNNSDDVFAHCYLCMHEFLSVLSSNEYYYRAVPTPHTYQSIARTSFVQISCAYIGTSVAAFQDVQSCLSIYCQG
jgi:hypothetical protein